MEYFSYISCAYISAAFVLGFSTLFGLLTGSRRFARGAAWALVSQGAALAGILLPFFLWAGQATVTHPSEFGDIVRSITFMTLACAPPIFLGWLSLELTKHRGSRAPVFPKCSACGYNLRGNVSGVCPECGTPTSLRPDKESNLARQDALTVTVFACTLVSPLLLARSGLKFDSPIQLCTGGAMMLIAIISSWRLMRFVRGRRSA